MKVGDANGRWTLVEYLGRRREGRSGSWRRWFRCKCACGTVREVSEHSMAQGSRSCGCLRKEVCRAMRVTHGQAQRKDGTRPTPEYTAYRSMLQRCFDLKNPKYGGRGIRVCDEWVGAGGFERFFAHIGPRPSSGHSLGRIDNDGNYEPRNVRWETAGQQAMNRRSNRVLTVDGRSQTMTEWARELGLDTRRVWAKLEKGWSVRKALGLEEC